MIKRNKTLSRLTAGAAGLLLFTALGLPAQAQNSITWNVAGDGVWDTSTANWTGDSTLYTEGDNVTFDNAAGGTITVLGLSPTSTTVNNASGEYIFVSEVPTTDGGAPSILAGTLVKDGAGTLQLGASNIPGPWTNPPYENGFTSVTVNGGLIEYADHDAFGTGTVTMAGGSSLRGTGSAEGRYLLNQEDLANDFVLTSGAVDVPMSFNPGKDIWLDGDISGSGGFNITGSHRTLSLSGDNTFTGGVTLESTSGSSPNALQIGTYNGLGTGTLTASQTVNSGTRGGLLAGENLNGSAADRQGNVSATGVTNPIVIATGRYFNVSGASDSKNLLLSGVISGDGTLRKHKNNSTVTLSGTNTYTGGTIIDAGTLKMDVQADDALGTGPVTLNAGTLFLERINATNDLVVNGGKVFGSNGFGNSWAGTVTLNADLTVESTTFGGPTKFNGVISGAGGLILTGMHGVELTAANDYTGDTTVNSGTLIVNGDSIADTNKLVIDGGKVQPVGTETVDTLFFGGTQQDAGTYGSTSSTATNQDDTRFSGTGVVNVLTGLGIDQAEILSFGLPGWPGDISGTDIAWTVPVGTDVTNLAPTFEISFGATATPVSGTARDFTTPQTYSIESGDTTVTNVYTVTVTEGAVPSVFDWINASGGNWSDTANWTNDLASGTAPGAFGGSFYTLWFNEPGTYTATHDLSDGFLLNQINFAARVTVDGVSGLEFTIDDTILPEINQNSGNEVTLDVPLTLGADTTLGGTGGGWLNLFGDIDGTGSLTVDGIGTFRMKDSTNANTYSGGTIINSGTLRLDYPGNDDFPTDAVLGTGPVTLNGGTLYLWRVNPTNALTVNGGLIVSDNGFGSRWSGPITLNVDTTVQCNFTMRVFGDISGPGGLIKTNGAELQLRGNNSYAGDTTVMAGTLRTYDADSLADGADVYLAAGTTLHLDHSGTETIRSLYVDGVLQPLGSYDNTAAFITGGGTLNVTVGPGGGGVPDIIDIEVDGSGNVVLTLDGSEAGLTAQQSDDLTDGSFADVASTPGTSTLTIDAADVDPDADGADFFRVRN